LCSLKETGIELGGVKRGRKNLRVWKGVFEERKKGVGKSKIYTVQEGAKKRGKCSSILKFLPSVLLPPAPTTSLTPQFLSHTPFFLTHPYPSTLLCRASTLSITALKKTYKDEDAILIFAHAVTNSEGDAVPHRSTSTPDSLQSEHYFVDKSSASAVFFRFPSPPTPLSSVPFHNNIPPPSFLFATITAPHALSLSLAPFLKGWVLMISIWKLLLCKSQCCGKVTSLKKSFQMQCSFGRHLLQTVQTVMN
jgi:hypothetical protein